ncbi:hypothetical protein FA15DRAFT_757150, partial [Coprinopsis marcescibilis]
CRDWDLAVNSQAHLCSPITTHLAPNSANTVQSFRRLITCSPKLRDSRPSQASLCPFEPYISAPQHLNSILSIIGHHLWTSSHFRAPNKAQNWLSAWETDPEDPKYSTHGEDFTFKFIHHHIYT